MTATDVPAVERSAEITHEWLDDLAVELDRMSARGGKGKGRASVGGKTACECELMFVIVDP